MKRVHFSMNYKAAEAYMARMCQKGWAAVRRTGCLWTFAPCKPSQYAFRLCCLRGLLGEELDSRKRRLAGRGIEFVSGGSSWAIFRSESPFHLYTPEEEDALCRKIRRSLAAGVLLGLLVLLGSLFLVNRLSPWFFRRPCTAGAAPVWPRPTPVLSKAKERNTWQCKTISAIPGAFWAG